MRSCSFVPNVDRDRDRAARAFVQARQPGNPNNKNRRRSSTYHCFLAMNLALRTGSSVTSKDLSMVLSFMFHIATIPLYRLASSHGSVGCRSTPLTRSDLWLNCLVISSRSGMAEVCAAADGSLFGGARWRGSGREGATKTTGPGERRKSSNPSDEMGRARRAEADEHNELLARCPGGGGASDLRGDTASTGIPYSIRGWYPFMPGLFGVPFLCA